MTHRFLGSPSENNGLCPQPGLAETLLFGGFTSRLAAAADGLPPSWAQY
jgi:hypothetical protein